LNPEPTRQRAGTDCPGRPASRTRCRRAPVHAGQPGAPPPGRAARAHGEEPVAGDVVVEAPDPHGGGGAIGGHCCGEQVSLWGQGVERHGCEPAVEQRVEGGAHAGTASQRVEPVALQRTHFDGQRGVPRRAELREEGLHQPGHFRDSVLPRPRGRIAPAFLPRPAADRPLRRACRPRWRWDAGCSKAAP
jgi:hypothetical protein